MRDRYDAENMRNAQREYWQYVLRVSVFSYKLRSSITAFWLSAMHLLIWILYIGYYMYIYDYHMFSQDQHDRFHDVSQLKFIAYGLSNVPYLAKW